ncbi:MAG TPA: poly-gamma-glutamate synthase PgsB [Syntrophorhabdales bacterium]|nr:poly-gamma-glutamate synthase PgsB [Syntrophorhabdales bacterium]
MLILIQMIGADILLIVLVILILFGLREGLLHRRNLSRIPIRIHVNGTRGKSSVVRLIAGGLREGGIVTCAKTTGTLARMILPDASEYPVFRPAGANVIEQVRIISVAASYSARAVVVECMALQPQLQWLCESRFLKATHGVITNARADHLDVMGPEEKDVALALAGSTPLKAKLFTAENRHLPVFEYATRDRQTKLLAVTPEEITAITDEEMEGFSYVEHKENVALALRLCLDLGVNRETALRGMWKAIPDPGAMTISHLRFFGRHIYFVNAFAANDPESSELLYHMAIDRFPDVEKRVLIFNCRTDRPDRSRQLGEACVQWPTADHYLLMGSGTYFLVRAAVANGIPTEKFLFAERQSDSDIFETIIELAGKSALVVGMGNTKGQGLSLVRFFRNRSILKETVQKEAL